MMENPNVPQDDVLDVMEMNEKLEAAMSNILNGNEMDLSMSALMSATINCILGQCNTLNEAFFYRNIFVSIFDKSIRSIEIKEK